MTCNGCRSHVEEALSKVKGVSKATVDLKKAEATIEMEKHIIILTALFLSLQLNAQIHLQNDSLNIPVYLVDGVEVQNLDSLKQDDIISVNVVKDKNILKYFYPRMGGIMCITTKSKRYLKPIQQKYFKQLEEAKKRRKNGEFLIR